MQVYKYLFTKTALELTKSYINFMPQPWFFIHIHVGLYIFFCNFASRFTKSRLL